MSYENIQLSTSSFTIDSDGNFYYFLTSNDMLYEKNSAGEIIFTYPLDTSLGDNDILSLHYDGINFWTMQEGSTTSDREIKKWRIENYICVLIDTISLDSTTTAYVYESDSMAIESHLTTLSEDASRGQHYIPLENYASSIVTDTVLTIGPTSDGTYEEVTATGTISDGILGLDFYLTEDHSEGECVSFIDGVWLFNNYTGTTESACICKYSLIDNDIEYTYEDSDLTDISASTFYESGDNNYITFIYGSTLRFFNIDSEEVTKSMVIDNIKADDTTIIPVAAIEIVDGTLYRLQQAACYYATDYSWSTYNYQCSPIRSFIDSISMNISPTIISADGISIVEVNAIVQDQFSDPAQYKTVHFSDDDDNGYMTISDPLTDLTGDAVSYYRAGTSVNTVTITAYVTQYD